MGGAGGHLLELVVRGWECGYGGPLRLPALLDYLQEAAGESAERLGFGMEEFRAEGRTWMLSRIDLRVEALPGRGETVHVRTRPAGIERLFALRDFILESAAGTPLVRAVYAYLVVDLAARRPLRPERALAGRPMGEPSTALPGYRFGARAAAPGSLVRAFPLQASPRHIDGNGHVNNAHLASWLADAAPRAERGTGTLCELKVEFSAEVLEGDSLEAWWGRLEPETGNSEGARDKPGSLVVTELRRGGEVIARAETLWW